MEVPHRSYVANPHVKKELFHSMIRYLSYEHLFFTLVPFRGTALWTLLGGIPCGPGVVTLEAGYDSNAHWLSSLYAMMAHYFLNRAQGINTSCKAIHPFKRIYRGYPLNHERYGEILLPARSPVHKKGNVQFLPITPSRMLSIFLQEVNLPVHPPTFGMGTKRGSVGSIQKCLPFRRERERNAQIR